MTYESGTLEPESVRGMFDRIAPVYDVMNRVLDACCGTGDLAVEAERHGGRVVGLDFSPKMLERARRKSGAIEWVQGDALALPFRDGDFDAATVGFGVRNLADLEGGLRELARVLRPGGKLAVLEITRPRGILKPFFRLWFDVLVPFAGRVLPGGEAYTYLPASVRRFPGPDDLTSLLEGAGFADVRHRLLGGGSVALHVGVKT
jgi:demethylmenaquinone methyltransferase/2-methoxy-6-polyprenyl-1,4-benzoquinol methylase